MKHPMLLAGLAALLHASGCAALNVNQEKFFTADARNPVVRVLTLWEPAEGVGLDRLPSRGFAGQILFFTAGSAQPVLVRGKVRVYLFDDQGAVAEQARPLHQFDFLPDAWATHATKTTLGPAYNVFIPYVRPGCTQARCSLRVRFEPAEAGSPVYSDMVHVFLPGPEAAGHSAAEPATRTSGSLPPPGIELTRRRGPAAEVNHGPLTPPAFVAHDAPAPFADEVAASVRRQRLNGDPRGELPAANATAPQRLETFSIRLPTPRRQP